MAIGLAVGWTLWQAGPAPTRRWVVPQRADDPWPQTPWQNARPGVHFVGDAACARCHRDITESFRRHPMGRSLAPIASAPAVGRDRSDGSTSFEAGSSRFTIERRGGREIHRETQRDPQGQILAQVEAEVAYALGSGTRGVSYLIERDGRLFQSPISWYSQKQRWDLSPGYQRRNYHFDRPIEPQCLFCHANHVAPVPLAVNRYQEPIFQGHAIGCERCHGPGELHVRRPELVDGRDPTIVNPRHLEPSLRATVCEQCHLVGDHRIERRGRDPFDYRPGLPSSAFFAAFGRADARGTKAVGHVEQMKASRCYRASRGRLGCTSCHDPHQVPAPEEKIAHYRQQCLACHEPAGCSLPEPARRAESREDSCIHCHMPMASSFDIIHIASTDHRILRSPQTRMAEPDPADLELPLVLLNGDETSSEGLETLQRELAIALMAEVRGLPDAPPVRRMGSLALGLLDQALAHRPDDLVARCAQAEALALLGRHREAIQLDQAVLESAPSCEQVLDDALSYAIELGDPQAALALARRSVSLNPGSATFHERLAYAHLQRRDWGEVLKESRAALRLNPFLRFARMFVVQCLLHQHDLQRAEAEFANLTGLNPTQRESLGRWFAAQRRSAGL
jgi:hypothetical protein